MSKKSQPKQATAPVKRTEKTSESEDSSVEELDQFMATMDNVIADNPALASSHCPYHSSILEFNSNAQSPDHADTLDRYLAEGAGEQASLFLEADRGPLLIHSKCTCWMLVGVGHA